MPKRKVRFPNELDDADEIPNSRLRKINENEEADILSNEPSTSADREKKHTLDSDEEDEVEKYERFDAEKFEGQEEATVEYDGRTKIMPFNMKEDLEEGHFASDGTFIFNKQKEMIKDAWLDNINWDNVKNSAGKLWEKNGEKGNESNDAESIAGTNVEKVYERLLELLPFPTEKIDAALKRLNSEKGLSAAEERKQRWAAKKAGRPFETINSKTVSELTLLVDSLISMGHMNAYQFNAANIRVMLEKLHKPKAKADIDTSEPFDMFGDESVEQASNSNDASKTHQNENDKAKHLQEVTTFWEFRVKDAVGQLDEKLHGPYSSDRMEAMKENELLKYGGMARKVGTDAFYDMNRIDFDLYD